LKKNVLTKNILYICKVNFLLIKKIHIAMKKLIILFFVIGIFGISIISCDKDNTTTNYNQQTAIAQNYAFVQGIYSDIFKLVCLASGDSTLMASGTGVIGGANVVYDSVNHTYQFNFGTKKSINGKSGAFTADCDGNFQDQGTKTNISFNNFYVGNSRVEGSNDITNMGKLSKKTGITILYSDSIHNAKIITANDTTIFNAGYSVSWSLNNIFNTQDDEYTFGGFINGSTGPNKSFTANISPSNLIFFTPACSHIVSGIINMVMNTIDTNNAPVTTNVTVDFIQSDGCNNQIQVTTNGTIVSFPIQ